MPPDGAAATLDELARFERGLHDAASMSHAEHVRIAFEMSARHTFDEALHRYASGLRRLTRRIGQPDKFNATITTAFLAVVAERRIALGATSWSELAERAPELLDRRCLERWYPAAMLVGELARATFLLPPMEREG